MCSILFYKQKGLSPSKRGQVITIKKMVHVVSDEHEATIVKKLQ